MTLIIVSYNNYVGQHFGGRKLFANLVVHDQSTKLYMLTIITYLADLLCKEADNVYFRQNVFMQQSTNTINVAWYWYDDFSAAID